MDNKAIKIQSYQNPSYHKCESCGRAKDILFRAEMMDAQTQTFLVGAFDLCSNCGNNLADILGVEVVRERKVGEFRFD